MSRSTFPRARCIYCCVYVPMTKKKTLRSHLNGARICHGTGRIQEQMAAQQALIDEHKPKPPQEKKR